MHDILNAIILGVVEGLTEFLPVSSTAHLLMAQQFLGFNPPGEVFPIVIQFGAILSVVAVYWRKFWDVIVGLPHSTRDRKFAWAVIVAFLPAAFFGAALHGFIKQVLFSPEVAPKVIATTLDPRRHSHSGAASASRPSRATWTAIICRSARRCRSDSARCWRSCRACRVRAPRSSAANCSAWSARPPPRSHSISRCRPCWARPCSISTRTARC